MTRLLIVEDDTTLAELIADGFEKEGWRIEILHNGKDAEQILAYNKFDLIILDIGLPDKSGLQICMNHRMKGGRTAVLFLTAEDKPEQISHGLEVGADDYVTKPFHMGVLKSRVRALLRRTSGIFENILQADNVFLNTRTREVTMNGAPLELRRMEYELLQFFMKNPNRTFTWQELVEFVWSSDGSANSEAVRSQIMRLRQKLKAPDDSSPIETVFGSGYRLHCQTSRQLPEPVSGTSD